MLLEKTTTKRQLTVLPAIIFLCVRMAGSDPIMHLVDQLSGAKLQLQAISKGETELDFLKSGIGELVSALDTFKFREPGSSFTALDPETLFNFSFADARNDDLGEAAGDIDDAASSVGSAGYVSSASRGQCWWCCFRVTN